MAAVEQVLARTGVSVVGKATSPARALALIERHRPEIFITEIDCGDERVNGAACIRLARERVPELKIIVLSSVADTERIDEAFSLGAAAYVIKTAQPDDLASAIRQAFEHSVYLAGSRPAATGTTNDVPVTTTAGGEESPKLTRRELEILQLVAEGHSNAELAQMLWVTEQTVKFHLSNVYRKLNVSNRTEASRCAQVRGLLRAAGSGSRANQSPAAESAGAANR